MCIRDRIRNEIANFRKEKKVFPVVLKGIYAITDVADLTYIIQQQVAAALRDKNIDIATKTDFQSVIQILKRGDLDSFFENLINKNIELQGYAANKEQLILALENNETKVTWKFRLLPQLLRLVPFYIDSLQILYMQHLIFEIVFLPAKHKIYHS